PMRIVPALLLVAIAVASLATADDGPASGDLAKLQGKWKAKPNPDVDRSVVLEVKGTALTVSIVADRAELGLTKGEIALDEAADPKAMDWTKMARGGQSTKDNRAIYRLDGDTLAIRFPGPDDRRPSAF